MTLRNEIETLAFIIFVSIMCVLGIVAIRQPKHVTPFHLEVPLSGNFLTPVPSPTLVPAVTTTSQISSDGTKKMTMKEIKGVTTNSYTFTLADIPTKTSNTIFFQTVATSSAMSIPFNVFSPQNTYFYLEQIDSGTKRFLVFKTSGENFANGLKYLDVTEIFKSYSTDNTMPLATGWGDDTLLVVNAKSTNGQGISFWFEVPSQHFIPLSNYFP